jgi:H/ACA ribonucleoprotein complex subunit 4
MGKLPFEERKYEILIKREATTSEEFGCFPDKRPVTELIDYGIVNLNKPSGPTSHQVADYVKKILNLDKVGHSGSLDPKVTGVLPIALGKGTKVLQTLLKAGKEYICLMHLHKEVGYSKIYKLAKEFTGEIEQIPPIKSAVKRVKRKRYVYYFEILEIEGKEVLFKLGCEAGTYIRKLVHDFGLKLGCGAHMTELIRTKAGPFGIEEAVSLHDLKDGYEYFKEGSEKELRKIIKPIEFAVSHLKKIWIMDNAVDSLAHGADLSVPGIVKLDSDIRKGDIVAVMSLKNEIICIGNANLDSRDIMGNNKGLALVSKRVFMERGIYPKFSKN